MCVCVCVCVSIFSGGPSTLCHLVWNLSFCATQLCVCVCVCVCVCMFVFEKNGFECKDREREIMRLCFHKMRVFVCRCVCVCACVSDWAHTLNTVTMFATISISLSNIYNSRPIFLISSPCVPCACACECVCACVCEYVSAYLHVYVCVLLIAMLL